MAQKTPFRKRPCRICGKWFMPNPRLGERQKTCGADACKRQWHTEKCAEWNRKNRDYFKDIYLRNRLEVVSPDGALSSPSPAAHGSSPLQIPREAVQEVIGPQQLIIIEYIVRLLLRSVQEVISTQHHEISRELRRLVGSASLRGDGLSPPAGVSSFCS